MSVTVPPSVTAPAGLASAAFTATVGSMTADATALLNASLNGSSKTFSLALDAPSGFAPIRVNAGGPVYTDAQGLIWGADAGYSGGGVYGTTSPVMNTTTSALYQTERYGAISYVFTMPNGTYDVNLKFAEIFFWQPGQRIFSVAINGGTVLPNFDIVAQAGGGGRAVDKLVPIAVTNGTIRIDFTPVVNNPKISAIEILPRAGVSVAVNPASANLGPSQVQQFSASVTGTANSGVNWSISPGVGAVSAMGLYAAPLSISSAQTVTVTATSVADPARSASAVVNLVPAGAFTPIRVNAGGPAYTSPTGQDWSVDTGFSGGSTYQTTASIRNTTTPVLYQSERYGAATYTYAVPNGTYKVKLKFAEIYFGQAGRRIFNVVLNGQTVLMNFDIFVAAGGSDLAVDREFLVTVSGGRIVIQLVTVLENPKISGIEIVSP
jgi:hypothetical protein